MPSYSVCFIGSCVSEVFWPWNSCRMRTSFSIRLIIQLLDPKREDGLF